MNQEIEAYISIDGFSDVRGINVYDVYRFSGKSATSMAYHFNITFVSEVELDFSDIIDKEVLLSLTEQKDRTQRKRIYGKVYAIEERSIVGNRFLYAMELRSPYHYLSLNSRYAIYSKKKVPTIITEIIARYAAALNLKFVIKVDETNLPEREHCTQYNQSDAEFIKMLCEEEGFSLIINYEKEKDAPFEIVLCELEEHAPVKKDLLSCNFNHAKKFKVTSHQQHFYDHANPTLAINNTTGKELDFEHLQNSSDTKELKDLLYHEHVHDRLEKKSDAYVSDIKRYSSQDALREQAKATRIKGESTSLDVNNSFYIKLVDYAAKKEVNTLVVETDYEGYFPDCLQEYIDNTVTQKQQYIVTFEAIEETIKYRPAMDVTKPRINGILTALVASDSSDTTTGENTIDVDKEGKIKVIFHFDQNRPVSAYVRLGTMFAGNNWGAQFLPRVNTEVIISFINGNIDQPVIIGALYNGDNAMPQPLPENKTQSYIKTRSMAGEGYNELLFEDKSDEELLSLRAQKDYKLHALHDSAINIDNDQVEEVGNDETNTIGNDRTESVGNNESISIGVDRTENVGANETISVGANRTTSVGANETTTIGGNFVHTVTMNNAETIAIAKALSVGAGYQISVGGAKNETVGLSSTEQVGVQKSMIIGERLEISVGDSSLILNADGTIILSGKEIKLSGSKQISVNGKMVEIN